MSDWEHYRQLGKVFIVGSPKSGTTLLQSLFDGHSQLATLPVESAYYRRYHRVFRGTGWFDYRRFKKYWTRSSPFAALARPRAAVGSEDPRDFTAYDYSAFSRRVMAFRADDHSRSAFFLRLLSAVVAAERKAMQPAAAFVEKTPAHVLWVDTIRSDFPDAKFIQVIRDPRDNYLALARQRADLREGPSYDGFQVDLAVRKIKPAFDLARFYTTTIPDSYRVVRYEDVVNDPERSMRSLAEHCGVEFEEILTTPMLGGSHWSGNSSSGARFDGIDASRVGVYRSSSSEAVIEAARIFERELDDFEYPR